ncbi:putative Post-SET domain-containing protein [Senna tora]|uniref:Putative Post-SET domain-containing protein n=1 Tax=Senna tora TaxID=362788 RepID=A0A834TPV4_9FABA|nr:putative Post-SET domain-containing protein [Senna tora]
MGGGTMHHVGSPLPHPRTSSIFTSSSSSSSPNLKLPISTENGVTFSYRSSDCCCCCDGETCRKLEVVNGAEEKISREGLYNHVFDAVPSQMEVQDALIALQNLTFLLDLSSASFVQAVESIAALLPHGYNRLYDALQLLQTDPSIKRLVVSLSSDKAVWDAIMNNVFHLKVQDLPNSVECRKPQISHEPELSIDILSWILEIIKGKVVHLIENFQSLVNDLFQSPKIGKAALNDKELEGKVRSSMLLSVVILLIVIMARVQRL